MKRGGRRRRRKRKRKKRKRRRKRRNGIHLPANLRVRKRKNYPPSANVIKLFLFITKCGTNLAVVFFRLILLLSKAGAYLCKDPLKRYWTSLKNLPMSITLAYFFITGTDSCHKKCFVKFASDMLTTNLMKLCGR
jgi:hypothetical protein